MMILYLLLLLLLVLARVFVAARAKRLEKKYVRAASTARELVTQPVYKNGNSNRTDTTVYAKQQYLLGQVVEKRDRIEARYLAWQARSEALGKLLVRIRNWKGRIVPYVGGVVDVGLALVLLNMLGIVDWPALSELIASLTSKWSG